MEEQKQKLACIYARCSTDENRQDVEVQLCELRRYCDAYNLPYEEVSEYGSGYKGNQPKLDEVIENIRLDRYSVLIVYSMDRFSRQSPSKINALLDTIVEKYGCRFIALQQGIDSENELTFAVVKPLFVYFANKFSRDLGDKIRRGIALKKAKQVYKGGRPKKSVDVAAIEALRAKGLSIRKIVLEINAGRIERNRVSISMVQRLIQKHGENTCGQPNI
jgi:DNA invertase Pin-like site-specific DNA recombinase